MSLRAKVFGLVEVVLRVPPLFIIDGILKHNVGFEVLEHDLSGQQTDAIYNQHLLKQSSSPPTVFTHGGDGGSSGHPDLNNFTAAAAAQATLMFNPLLYRFTFAWLLKFLFCFLGCSSAMCMFVLNTKHLVVVYMWLLSLIVVFLSYLHNVHTVHALTAIALQSSASQPPPPHTGDFLSSALFTNSGDSGPSQLFTALSTSPLLHSCIVQAVLCTVFIHLHLGPRKPLLQNCLPLAFFATAMAAYVLPLPSTLLYHIPILSSLVPSSLVVISLWSSVVSIYQTLRNGYLHSKMYVGNFGIPAFVEAEWLRLGVPEVLRIFWVVRTLKTVALYVLMGEWEQSLQQQQQQQQNGAMDGSGHTSAQFRLLKHILVTGCDTLTAVLGITSVVSYISNYIGTFFQWLLMVDEDADKNFGTISAIVFYILALQTGLTNLDPHMRFVRLCRNFCLLFTAILHIIHNMVNPLLMSLSASHNPAVRRHVHTLAVCTVLVVLPATLMYYLWSTQTTSTWLLAVTAFSVEVMIKVAVSLVVYGLFLWDARRDTFWEQLDDYIYYARSFGSTVEFCFGIFLFFNGAWILVFESGSAIRAIMMCIHAYCNIWCEAKAGWSVFIKRRTAVNKIESLPEADDTQLRRLDDVCAICYQEMKSAKITKCQHYFHGVCLRKWLYVQDRCPLCHEILHAITAEKCAKGAAGTQQQQQQQQQQQPHRQQTVQLPAVGPPPDDDDADGGGGGGGGAQPRRIGRS